MAGIFGGGNSANKPQYTSLQLQTSALGVPIPIVYGFNRCSANIIWYNNFQASKQKQGKGGQSSSGSYNYSCSCIMGICEGQIGGVNQVWASGSLVSLASLGLDLYNGTDTQTAYPYVETNYPSQALPYPDLAYVASGDYDLGSSASLPSHEFEVLGLLSYTSGIAPAFTTANGAVTNSNNVTVASSAGIYPNMYVLTGVQDKIPQYTTVYSVAGNVVNLSNPVNLNNGDALSFSFFDANPAFVLSDYLTNTRYGLAMAPALIGNLQPLQTYCEASCIFLSPIYDQQEQCSTQIDRLAQLTNSWIFWNGTQIQAVPLANAPITGNGVTYTPNTTPIYTLEYKDYIFTDGEDPVTIERVDPSDAYNDVKIEINDRINKAYQSNSLEAKDQASIDQYGVLAASSVQARECCDPNIGNIIVQLILQRYVYVRNTYKFKLGVEFSLITVGDILALNEPNIPLVNFTVRVKSMSEDDNYNIDLECEECPVTVGFASYAPVLATTNAIAPVSSTVSPGDVNTPVFFEPPAVMSDGVPQVWVGTSGSSQYWGGCNVWLSVDGTNYTEIGQIDSSCTQGVLLSNLALGSDPDTIHTLAVNLTESLEVITPGATHADADAFRTPCVVDNEIICYGSTAVGGTQYEFNLTYLRRGVYGTTVASHNAGAPFAKLDGSIFTYNLPAAYIGVTLYAKFQSFNILGAGLEELSNCTVYTYSPIGTGFIVDPPTNAVTTSSVNLQTGGTSIVYVTTTWTASPDPLLNGYDIEWSNDGGVTWPGSDTIPQGQTSYTLQAALPSTSYTFRVRAFNTVGNSSSWANAATITSSIATGGYGANYGVNYGA
jgi:hypothetical protein